jgi:transcriptional regulator with XRE-family HTH domain
MAKKTAPLLPSTDELLQKLGERLRLARRRRHLSAKQVSERAGMAPMTLRSLERGGPGVTMGAYVGVMQVLGVEKDLDLLVKADPLGRELQDARLPVSRRMTRTAISPPSEQTPAPPKKRVTSTRSNVKSTKATNRAGERDWIAKSGFASSDDLVGLIDPVTPRSKKKG